MKRRGGNYLCLFQSDHGATSYVVTLFCGKPWRFAPGSDGSATLVTNPAGERTLSIQDGLGRTVRTAQLDANGAALTQQTMTYDTVIALSGLGSVVETSSANLLGNTTKQDADGLGRSLQTIDAENFVSTFQYDPSGNRLKSRDPNQVGEDCQYDVRGRKTQCADTREQSLSVNRRYAYNMANQVITEYDAKNHATANSYDSLGRRMSQTDRLGNTTTWTYDPRGMELSLTDAENQTTVYGYDTVARRSSIQWPDHVANTNPGDQTYGITTVTYDAANRPTLNTDQKGDTQTLTYDLAGRMTTRAYRTLSNSPTGAMSDQDTFTYDPPVEC